MVQTKNLCSASARMKSNLNDFWPHLVPTSMPGCIVSWLVLFQNCIRRKDGLLLTKVLGHIHSIRGCTNLMHQSDLTVYKILGLYFVRVADMQHCQWSIFSRMMYQKHIDACRHTPCGKSNKWSQFGVSVMLTDASSLADVHLAKFGACSWLSSCGFPLT